MVTTLTLTHPSINSGVPVKVLCSKCTPSGKKNLQHSPNANLTGSIVEVQTQSIENIKYSISGVHFTEEANTLTYAMLLTLYKLKYGGAGVVGADEAIILNATYGKVGNQRQLIGIDGSTSIKVVLEDFSFPIDMTDTIDGDIPIGSITLVDTA